MSPHIFRHWHLNRCAAKSSGERLGDICEAVLNAVRSTLADRATSHNATVARVSTLPAELLSTVFHQLPADTDRLRVSQACRQWRAVAHDDATLWTEQTLAHAGDAAVACFGPRLDLTKGAPLTLDLSLRDHRSNPRLLSEARIPALAETLGRHMHHVRELKTKLHTRVDAERFLAALSVEAPDLETLHLVNLSGSGAGALALPADMFKGSAPRLRTAVLERFALPPDVESIPSWRAVQDLAYNAPDRFNPTDIDVLMRSCPSLRRVALVLRDCADVTAAATRPPFDPALCPDLHTVFAEGGGFRTDHGLVPTLTRFAALPSVAQIGVACPTDTELALLLGTLDGSCDKMAVVTRTGYSFSLSAHTPMVEAEATSTPSSSAPEGPMRVLRAWKLHLHHFATVFRSTPPAVFASLRELTIAEALWSEGPHPLPALPHLRTLSIVLATEKEYFDPGASWGSNFAGIFQMAVPSRAREEDADSDDEDAVVPATTPGGSPHGPILPVVPAPVTAPVATQIVTPSTDSTQSDGTSTAAPQDAPTQTDNAGDIGTSDSATASGSSSSSSDSSSSGAATSAPSADGPTAPTTDAAPASAASDVVSVTADIASATTDAAVIPPPLTAGASGLAAAAVPPPNPQPATAQPQTSPPAAVVPPPMAAPPAPPPAAPAVPQTPATARWSCPSLQTFRLISSAPTIPTVSTRDVAQLMTHHLAAGSPGRLPILELLRVRLYDEGFVRAAAGILDDEEDTPLLETFVKEVVILDEGEERWKAFWDPMFADATWAGAIGASDNWVTR